MKHVRDPVTGRCTVCESGHMMGPGQVTNQQDPNARPTWDQATKKVIYVNAFNNKPQPRTAPGEGIYNHPPASPPPKARPTSTSGVFVVANSPPPSSTTYHQHNDYTRHGRGRNQPPDRSRTPSPDGGCCRGSRNSRGYNRGREVHEKGYYDRYGRPYDGRVDPNRANPTARGAPYNSRPVPPAWGRRRCCAVIAGILILLLLIGLIVGLYFLIKEMKDNEEENSPENRNPNGRYVNGVWVVGVTQRPPGIYLVYGMDQPCNPFNNNTFGANNNTYPNCDTISTWLVLNNSWTSTLAATTVLTTSGATSIYVPLLFIYVCLWSAHWLALAV